MSTTPTVADIIREALPDYTAQHGTPHRAACSAIRAITACRTPAMGGTTYACDGCGQTLPRYHSCRNRNCPTCQTTRRMQWVQARTAELLPVGYFHVVFTIPAQLNAFALRNQAAFYRIMFAAVSQTLLSLAADRNRLGAQLGFFAVLHTWGQNLLDHPHIHCVVPGGGINDKGRWVPARQDYLLPVAVMSGLFRGKFMAAFTDAVKSGDIALHGSLAQYQDSGQYEKLLSALYGTNWVVYCKAPFGSAQAVVKYLGRYTHRVAISNQRILSIDQGAVQFSYKDYADASTRKIMTLSAVEFLRRFLMHVLPAGFVRIRYFGFLANRNRKGSFTQCLLFFGKKPPERTEPQPSAEPRWVQLVKKLTGRDPTLCPFCSTGHLVAVALIPRMSG
jgi:hypothetical protein